MSDTNHNGNGDGGRALSLPKTRILEGRAIRENWPISPEEKERIMRALIADATNQELSPRERRQSARVVIAADAVNVTRERTESDTSTSEQKEASRLYGKLLANPETRDLLLSTIAQERITDKISPPVDPKPIPEQDDESAQGSE